MIEKDYRINNKLGLHARPASMFVTTTGKYQSRIRVVKDNREIDGKSIMGLLMLAASHGTKLRVIVEGPDEGDLIADLDDLFARKFDDDED